MTILRLLLTLYLLVLATLVGSLLLHTARAIRRRIRSYRVRRYLRRLHHDAYHAHRRAHGRSV